MDGRNLYSIKFRKGMTGVQSGFLTASSLARAEELGHYWCDNQINCRFIRVEPAVIADESLLPGAEEEAVEEVETEMAEESKPKSRKSSKAAAA